MSYASRRPGGTQRERCTVLAATRQIGDDVAARTQRSTAAKGPTTKGLTKDLASIPKLISTIAAGHDDARLTARADEKTWSASDVLAHLRSAADIRGKWIAAMLDRDNPTIRAVSPRSAFRKYVDRDFAVSLKEFSEERAALVKRLRALDDAGWARTLTFTGASPRSSTPTVAQCVWGLVEHEKVHLDQFRELLG